MSAFLLQAETRVHVVAIVLYALAAMMLIGGRFLRRPGLVRWAGNVVPLAIGVHALALGARWAGSGHGPYVTKYEMLSAYAFVTAVMFALIVYRRDRLQVLGMIVYPVVFLMMALGLYTGAEVHNLPPTFSGIWLVIHVCFYVLAFATAVIALSSAALILRGKDLELEATGRFQSLESLDDISYRFGGLAFAFWGIGMLTGSIWAYYSWGRFWGWDPVETWSLVTWLAFGIYLHVRRFYAWEGKRAALLLIVCVALALFSLFGTSILSDSLHAVYFQ
ncbi:MAG: cytochrome c biogenesis protein CcsA [Coriobacteriia bacterium]|nr:cytochrome c biogenesis protein CcsA [Coriobacteriia bacterium]MBN2822457.1 cytochrome c biogenesis protein CcsA [Coriobacteriia bacterium]